MSKKPKLAHPRRLVTHAIATGMPYPTEHKFELDDALREAYPRFYLFCKLNLTKIDSVSFAELRKNAQAIADMPDATVNNMLDKL